ncbi:mechanosensitive ion channel [Sphingosinicellaceae bacterium]|nr:mechanosensitive ion channel [Sphingosinicellaceae bacterium]
MVGATFIPAVLLAATLIGVVAIRSRPAPLKLAVELALVALIAGLLISRGLTPLPTSIQLARLNDGPLLRALAVVWWLIAGRMVATLAVLGLGRDARSKQARLFSDLLAGAIYLTSILIILNSVLGLPINGVLATSGVIAIVLGLALQNTLADVFSGIAVGLEQPFHVGDRVSIADHVEGVVVEMNWRSIRIQTDGEDVATIPNSIVARSQIINRSVPTERRAATLDIPTLSTAPSEQLIGLIQQATLLCENLLPVPAPSVSLKYVGTRTATISVGYFVASTGVMTAAKSELLRQVRRLFQHAGIDDGQPPSRVNLLASLVLFDSLDEDQITRLAAGMTLRRLQPGEILFAQGSVGGSLYIIQSGILEIRRRSGDGRDVSLGKIGPGEYLGEISMMSGEPRAITTAAITEGSAFELPKAALATLLHDNRQLSAALERSVQRGLEILERDHAARSCEPLDQNGKLLERIRSFLGFQRP